MHMAGCFVFRFPKALLDLSFRSNRSGLEGRYGREPEQFRRFFARPAQPGVQIGPHERALAAWENLAAPPRAATTEIEDPLHVASLGRDIPIAPTGDCTGPAALYKSSVEYQLQRVFEGGRVMEKHVRIAGVVRGRLTVGQEHDSLRHRTVLVARLQCSGVARAPVHPLYDVTLVASNSNSESWTLAGFERIEAGPMRHVHLVGQAWIIEPLAIQALIDVERKWSAAAGRVHELGQQLIGLGRVLVASKLG